MSFLQWNVSKVCKTIFSLQTFRLKQFGALQTSICTHKAQTKIFSSKCCLFVDQKKWFFSKSQEGCAWCVHILFGVRRVYLDLYASHNLSDTSENPLGTLTTLVKICKNRDFPPETPLRQNFLVVENEFGVRSTPQSFFGRQWRSKAFPKLFLAINIMWLGF